MTTCFFSFSLFNELQQLNFENNSRIKYLNIQFNIFTYSGTSSPANNLILRKNMIQKMDEKLPEILSKQKKSWENSGTQTKIQNLFTYLPHFFHICLLFKKILFHFFCFIFIYPLCFQTQCNSMGIYPLKKITSHVEE